MSDVPVSRPMHDGSGTSLLEVMASIAIFAVVAVGAATGTIAIIRGNTLSRMGTTASAVAYDQIEAFRALDPTANPEEFAEGVHVDPANPITTAGGAGEFFRSWEVVRNTPAFGLAEVLVTVSWHDTEPRSISYTTYACLERDCS